MATTTQIDISTMSNEQLAALVRQAETNAYGGITQAAIAGSTARGFVVGGAGAVFDFFKGLTVGVKTPEQERAELLARLGKVQ